jgi:hypothetical protein
MDSVEDIQRDFLRGQELTLNAFNRLLAWSVPVVPVAMHVHVEVVPDEPKGPEATPEGA